MSLGVFDVRDKHDDAILMASVQGAFHGCNLPAARIEGLIASHVPKKHIVDVADVWARKWWDYRRLTPGHSFLLFAHHYYNAYRIGARTFIDIRKRTPWTQKGKGGLGLLGPAAVQYRVDEIWDREPKHITGLWTAMLTCDALGMPYDRFCQLANQVAVDTAWQRLPLPAQLYSEKMGAQVLDRWIELTKDRMILPRHPLFKLENYASLPVQDEFQDWLLDQLKRRQGDPVNALANVVYRTPQLPESVAAAEFAPAVMQRARLLAA